MNVGREEGVNFRVVHVGASPSGAAGGSFRIDELSTDHRGNEVVKVLGYNYSWPDEGVCRRLAVAYRQS